jgi:hypothetical protein
MESDARLAEALPVRRPTDAGAAAWPRKRNGAATDRGMQAQRTGCIISHLRKMRVNKLAAVKKIASQEIDGLFVFHILKN